jgi:hypothetical protein
MNRTEACYTLLSLLHLSPVNSTASSSALCILVTLQVTKHKIASQLLTYGQALLGSYLTT